MVHAKELGHCKDNPGVPGEESEGGEHNVEEDGWQEENGDFGITLNSRVKVEVIPTKDRTYLA